MRYLANGYFLYYCPMNMWIYQYSFLDSYFAERSYEFTSVRAWHKFSELAHRIFLIFFLKLGVHKCRKWWSRIFGVYSYFPENWENGPKMDQKCFFSRIFGHICMYVFLYFNSVYLNNILSQAPKAGYLHRIYIYN